MCGCNRVVRSTGVVRLVVLTMTGTMLVASGCGSVGNARTANDLKLLGLVYHNYINNNSKSPAKLHDLKPLMSDSPPIAQSLANGKYVFIYGVSLADMASGGTSNTIIGYEKDAPTKGGYVLFGDGAVRPISAKEF